MPRISKTEKLFIVQEYWGRWEDATASTVYKEAKADLKAYRENSPAPSRLITRRVPIVGA